MTSKSRHGGSVLFALVHIGIVVLLAHFTRGDRAFTSSSTSSSAVCSANVYHPACASHFDRNVKQKRVLFVSIAIRAHALPLLRIADEMKRRGYTVAFATHESGKDWVDSRNLTFVSAGPFPVSADALRTRLRVMTRDSSNFRGILTMFNEIYVAAVRPMFEALLPQVERELPDLIVYDVATLGAQDLAHKLRIPSIINSPSILFDLGGTPSYVPAWGTGFSSKMSLWNRCMNILFPRCLSAALTPAFMQVNKIRWELNLKPYRSQHELFRGTRIILNTAFGLDHPQPLSPLIDAVGPILPSPSATKRTISNSLRKWFETADEGIVYVNLGSMAYIDEWQAQIVVEALAMRPDEPQFKVFWLIPKDQRSVLPDDLPPNFRIKSSAAGVTNLDVLTQPNIRVVVSHCGMGAAQEALTHNKPLLCIPLLIDQPDVAARVTDAGAGLLIEKSRLTVHELHAKILLLAIDESFTLAAKRVGFLLKEAGGLDRAIRVIDSMLLLGSTHLETLDVVLPWHRVVMLDVWMVYISMFCLLAVIVHSNWLLMYSFVVEMASFVNQILFGYPGEEADDELMENQDKKASLTATGSGTSANLSGTGPSSSSSSHASTK